MSLSAGLGIATSVQENSSEFWRWVRQCEEGGIDSIWQSDRIIGKNSHLECLSTMAALAGATTKIKFGMNIASLGLRDAVITAKACATIDFLSEGRLLPAFGIGSTLSQDYSASGTPTKGRGKRTNEALEIMSRLWAEEKVRFNGTYYQLDNASISPRPIQKPLPLWVGGSSSQAIKRTARWGTGWQAGIQRPDEIEPVIKAIKEQSRALGRNIPNDHYGAGFTFRFGSTTDTIYREYKSFLQKQLGKSSDDLMISGDADDILELLHKFSQAGVRKFVLRPLATDNLDLKTQTDSFIKEILPRLPKLIEE